MHRLRGVAEEVHVRGASSQGDKSDLARAYFKFLLEKIASRIKDERLRGEMFGILDRERRPMADFLEVQNELAKAKRLPTPIEKSFFSYSSSTDVVDVTMFNEEWTRAYTRVL